MSRQPHDEEDTALVAGVDVKKDGFDWSLFKVLPMDGTLDVTRVEIVRSKNPDGFEVEPVYLSAGVL